MTDTFAGMEVPVVPGAPQSAWTNTYKAIIEQMLGKAEDIGSMLYAADEATMPKIVQELHSLTQFGRTFSFYAAMKYAATKGDADLVELVFRHPLLKVVHMYLATVEAGDGIYLDWTIEQLEQQSGFFFNRKTEVLYRVNYALTRKNPYGGYNAPTIATATGDMVPAPTNPNVVPKAPMNKASVQPQEEE